MTERTLPLSNIKVVEMGQNLSAPYASLIFADLGAEVIKVEKPGGDDARGWGPPFVEGRSVSFHMMNRNKQSVVLSLDREADRARFFELIADADIFIHNLRPGVAEKLDIGSDRLMAHNPRLIYCSMSAFGHSGPLSMKPGYEPLLQAFSGLISINGDPEGKPARIGASVVDMGTGMWTAIGALSALRQRDITNKGSVVETSLFETALTWASRHAADYGATGKVSPRVGTGHNSLTPYQAFQASDKEIIIGAGNDRLFAKLARVLGHPEWIEDPRFTTNRERNKHRAILIPQIEAIVAGQSYAYWEDKFDQAGVPSAPIHDIPDVLAHEQTKALGMVMDAPIDNLVLTALPVTIDGYRTQFGTIAPELPESDA